ncbi:MAG: ABC transporter substrate-binding protein [Geobacteraceae bacterium]|nr:ABC transporter substrate-binding protein [Geobacteraceae bacterium]
MDRVAIRLLFLSVAAAVMIGLFSVEARAEKRIGVLLWSEEPYYILGQKGIMEQLKADGFGEPAVKYTIENARGSKAKAVEAAQKFAASGMDLIITLGTSATLVTAKAVKDVPIVFCTVYDPVEAGIADDWKSSGNNTTGSSTMVPMSMIVKTLKEFAPVKRLAVLYTPGEKNSEAQLMELQKIQADSKVKVIPVILGREEEVPQTLAEVMQAADAIFLTGSSIVGATAPLIVDMANKGKVVTITHLDTLVTKGALLGVAANSYLVGRLAGKKAVKVLKGARPSSIPIETEKKLDILLNRKTAKAGGFHVPQHFMKKVTKVVE